MSRVHVKTRVSARLSQTLKRQREESDEGDSVHEVSSNSGGSYCTEPTYWKLAFNNLSKLTVSVADDVMSLNNHTVRIGSIRENLTVDANTLIFRGTATTRLKIQFGLPDGHLSVSWFGGQLIIDDTYSIVDKNITMWHQPPADLGMLRTIPILMTGERSDPITLSHNHQSYVIRLSDSHPAIVMPRCAYYPLKVVLMKDFIENFMPNALFERSPRSPEQLAEDPRVPPPSPRTPTSPESYIGYTTPPSRYVSNEDQPRMNELFPTDEETSD